MTPYTVPIEGPCIVTPCTATIEMGLCDTIHRHYRGALYSDTIHSVTREHSNTIIITIEGALYSDTIHCHY